MLSLPGMAHFRTPLLLLLVTLVSVGCAHTRSPIPTSALPKVPVEFEPIRIVTQTDDLIGLDAATSAFVTVSGRGCITFIA